MGATLDGTATYFSLFFINMRTQKCCQIKATFKAICIFFCIVHHFSEKYTWFLLYVKSWFYWKNRDQKCIKILLDNT